MAYHTFTTHKMCKLINKTYEPYLCFGDVELCSGVLQSCIFPCDAQNYKLLYDIQIMDKSFDKNKTNVVRMCAGSTFSTLSYPECTCFAHGRENKNEILT